MKHLKLVIPLLTLAVFAVACKPSGEKTAEFQIGKTEEMKEAAPGTDYTYAQKAEFTEAMQRQLDEINRDLDQISAKIEKSSDAAKAEAQPKLQSLRDQMTKLNKRLDQASGATESSWEEVKSGCKKGYAELKDGFQKARQWMSEKIAP